ncbi:unnamed protein product [Miscanthus lutarioriparius]|uniref:GRF-type domain-containing protein n=1 Tax=Miscanthus lutarioriparius TaxID=422564 RepID=A0A811PZ52_9POAL|nr:unnamed protein product [Miscanthus lutarioriparius]
MTHYAESSGGGRARSRLQGGRSTRIHSIDFDLVGELSGFPLIVCPECGLDRVVEGQMKKEGENQGRLYFKCARNTYPKVCGYYRFEKQYFQKLKDDGVIVVRPSNWAQMLDEEVDSVDYTNVDKPRQALEHPLEQKLDNCLDV